MASRSTALSSRLGPRRLRYQPASHAMPTFTRKDGRHFVSYITGPLHVLLGVSFGPADTKPVIVRQSHPGGCNHGSLDESRIREAVVAGIAEADVQLHPVEIIYCEGDSPHYELYRHCARALAQRVASGAEFPESQSSIA